MTRPLRINVAGGWYHVTARGHRRQSIYRDARDYNHFIDRLAECGRRYHLEVHAYVLMSNHYHILLRVPQANISPAIQWLNVSYSIWWNRRHGYCGSVFQGRFHAVLVEAGERARDVSLYIHLNPVAVRGLGLDKQGKADETQERGERPTREQVRERVERLRAYRWSSYAVYAGYMPRPKWLQTDDLLAQTPDGQAGYRGLAEKRIRAGYVESIWQELKWGIVLGSQQFVEPFRRGLTMGRETSGRSLVKSSVAWSDVIREVERVKGEPWLRFRDRHGDWGRDLVFWAARRFGGMRLRAIGARAGPLDCTAVAQSIRRLEARARKNIALRQSMISVETRLSNVKSEDLTLLTKSEDLTLLTSDPFNLKLHMTTPAKG